MSQNIFKLHINLLYMKDCIFCKIVNGEVPCYKIWEDERFLVFLDVFPALKGQTLVVPKKHSEGYLFDLEDQNYNELLLVAKKIAKAIDKSLKPVKTGLLVEGLEVNHAHVKLFPLEKEGFKLKPIEPKPSEEEFKEIAEKIKSAL